jgi:hypothetical protein
VMGRRGIEFTSGEQAILQEIFDQSKTYRIWEKSI